MLGPLLVSESVTKIAHDMKAQEVLLARHEIPIAGPVLDTDLAAYLLDPETPHDLVALSRRELDVTLPTPEAPAPPSSMVPSSAPPSSWSGAAPPTPIPRTAPLRSAVLEARAEDALRSARRADRDRSLRARHRGDDHHRAPSRAAARGRRPREALQRRRAAARARPREDGAHGRPHRPVAPRHDRQARRAGNERARGEGQGDRRDATSRSARAISSRRSSSTS